MEKRLKIRYGGMGENGGKVHKAHTVVIHGDRKSMKTFEGIRPWCRGKPTLTVVRSSRN